MFLEISQNSQKNTCVNVSLQLCQKADSGTGVFLWEHLLATAYVVYM